MSKVEPEYTCHCHTAYAINGCRWYWEGRCFKAHKQWLKADLKNNKPPTLADELSEGL